MEKPFKRLQLFFTIHNSPFTALPARMAETAIASDTLAKFLNLHQRGPGKWGEHQLSNTLTAPDNERLRTVVDHNHPDLATVIGVDGPGGVDQGNAVFEGQAASGPHLGLVPFRQLNGDPGRDKCTTAGNQHQLVRQLGVKVHACSMSGHISREGVGTVRTEPFYLDTAVVHGAVR